MTIYALIMIKKRDLFTLGIMVLDWKAVILLLGCRCEWGRGAPMIAHFRGHLCVFVTQPGIVSHPGRRRL